MNVPDGRVTAIIAAGGQGTRMGGDMPKQFAPLVGKPMLWHTLIPFSGSELIDRIVLVVPERYIDLCRERFYTEFSKLDTVVAAGLERHHSVLAGFRATSAEDRYLLIHDGARPLVSRALIEKVVSETVSSGAAIAATRTKETIKVEENGSITTTPDRNRLWCAQTPQGFRRDILHRAIEAGQQVTLPTDESTLVERLGIAVRLVEGEETNIKITTTTDMQWAEWTLQRMGEMSLQENRLRVGTGYDVHRFEEGRHLVLGGVSIPWHQGLAGHSDADVLIHAIIDALLGAARLGDIGRLFPDTDPEFAGISSIILLRRVKGRLDDRGLRIANIDAVIIAEQPKLAPYILQMEEALATALTLSADHVSVKATTSEQLGFVGRGEGIVAQAVAIVT